jgi:hypothetical protein
LSEIEGEEAGRKLQVGRTRHLARHVVLGLVFLACAAPYILYFVSNTRVGEMRDPALVFEISRTLISLYHTPHRLALGFLGTYWPYVLTILVGLIWLWRGRPDVRDFLQFVAGWCGGPVHRRHRADRRERDHDPPSIGRRSNTISCAPCATSFRLAGCLHF